MAKASVNAVNGTVKHASPKLGLLTRTVVKSPVIKWILPARIRHRRLNDVVFVGDDFVEVKQVKKGGHVEHVISKHDFASRICAADVFTIDDPTVQHEDNLLQPHFTFEDVPVPTVPAQLLVLTMESNVVMFLYLSKQDNGGVSFRHQFYYLPQWPDGLQQSGELIAVDPQARAMAIASRGGQIILYSAKSSEEFKEQLANNLENWCPVTQEKIMTGDDVIQHIAFLHPQHLDPDHVILLSVVVDPSTRKMRLKWFDWRVSLGIDKLQKHEPVPIDTLRCVPSLLIPLRGSNFILINGQHIDFYKDLLSGTPVTYQLGSVDQQFPPSFPGISPRWPLWINWCRPMRISNQHHYQDTIYLCREDGKVFHMSVDTNGTALSGTAGDLQCHVGQAFASLGDDMNPDLLAVAADMSTGRIVSIGDWSAPRINPRTREETMDMRLVELLPNWASVTDMIVAKIMPKTNRSACPRETVFLTSGSQPFGSITEMRKGLEARLLHYADLGDTSGMLDIWTLSDAPTGGVVLVLTTPGSTYVYAVQQGDDDDQDIAVVVKPGIFDTESQTLTAASTNSNRLVQITANKITVAISLSASFEDVQHEELSDGDHIELACIEPVMDMSICCEIRHNKCLIQTYLCPETSNTDNPYIQPGAKMFYPARALAMASAIHHDHAIVMLADEIGVIRLYSCNVDHIIKIGEFHLNDEPTLCDQMVLLSSKHQADSMVAICGLRDGTLLTTRISLAPSFRVDEPTRIPYGNSTVKLTRVSSEFDRAYAMCGTDTCLLTLDHHSRGSVAISNIWIADKNRPDLAQHQVLGCARIPPLNALSGDLVTLASSLVMLSTSELGFAFLSPSVSIVPRQMKVKGTPSRLLYAQTQRSLICASIFTEIIDRGRRCSSYIEYISPRTGLTTASYVMSPGEKVYSLLEWSPESDEKDKSYQLVLTGSKYLKNGNEDDERGRITFLHCSKDHSIKVQHTLLFEEPVYAMALYDKLTLVVCSGKTVALYRFSFEMGKMQSICRPAEIASSGTAVSCSAPLIYVTTMQDSMVILRVDQSQSNGNTSLCSLVISSTGPRAEDGICHAAVSLRQAKESKPELTLMTTREQEVVGLAIPPDSAVTHPGSARLSFEAMLPQSIIRIRRCNIRPAWKLPPPPGVLADNLIGSCTDGSLVGLAVLDEKLWRQLFWLQRLCEWDETTSPHRLEQSVYGATNEDYRGNERALPIGLAGNAEILLSAPESLEYRARDMHIDGDVLARILHRGGATLVRAMVESASKRQDHVGEWLRQHLDEDLAAVDGCMRGLVSLLDLWL